MKIAAIVKCKERLRRSEAAIAGMETSGNSREFANHWDHYLIAIKAIGEILRIGAQGNPKSTAFMTEIWKSAQGDPLVRYLLEARNVEEHGLERSAEYRDATVSVGRPGESMQVESTLGPEGGSMKITPLNGSRVTVEYSPLTAKLLPVTDKGHRTWAVPTFHFGQAIVDSSPANVAKLGLDYFSHLVRQAETLVDTGT